MKRPLLALTLGDPAGIGPEIIARAWRSENLFAESRPFVVGRPGILERAARLVGSSARVQTISAPEEAASDLGVLCCLPCGSDAADTAPPGLVDARGGQAAFDALLTAADLALAGRIDGLVTAPLSKAALWAAGHKYPGHTEILAERCGAKEVAMMLYLAPGPNIASRAGLGVAHVTLHMALRDVFANLSPENILSKARLADSIMRAIMGETGAPQEAPRLAVCALNPHAGEEGLFGDEETRVIQPAVEAARAAGLSVAGPLPADTLLRRAAAGEFDAVVAMYHDQGHIALKLLGMHRAVNITLGLPIVRTSVAHGTAFDIAWQGQAEANGLLEAVRVAARLANARRQASG